LNVAAGTWRQFDRTTRDLALGKTATASSESTGNPATSVTKATTYQNYTATRWESAASDPQTIHGGPWLCRANQPGHSQVVLGLRKAFKIQVSADSTTWIDVFSTTVGASYSVTDEKFATTTARYVRNEWHAKGQCQRILIVCFHGSQ